MSAALAPHCWKATSFADPEYVMDFRSPNAFCAFAITVFASCAMALPHRSARQFATPAILLNTTLSSFRRLPSQSHILYTHSVCRALRVGGEGLHILRLTGAIPATSSPIPGAYSPGDNWRF